MRMYKIILLSVATFLVAPMLLVTKDFRNAPTNCPDDPSWTGCYITLEEDLHKTKLQVRNIVPGIFLDDQLRNCFTNGYYWYEKCAGYSNHTYYLYNPYVFLLVPVLSSGVMALALLKKFRNKKA